jgi:AcrR family transcriptional regulator
VSDIIVDSKIARSTFYAHFESKLDIFQILVKTFYSEILLEAVLSINISRAAGAEPSRAPDPRDDRSCSWT